MFYRVFLWTVQKKLQKHPEKTAHTQLFTKDYAETQRYGSRNAL